MNRTWSWMALGVALSLAACGDGEPDAWGSFEATEVVVSAEVSGPLRHFEAVEGERLAAGRVVGTVDTVQTALQIAELEAQQASATAQARSSGATTGALQAELNVAATELARTRRLFEARAATRQQLDAAQSRVDVLRARIEAAREQTTGAGDQAASVDARLAQLRDQLDRSRIRNPIDGTVLTTYVHRGELVQRGQPLYRIANLDTLTLRAYVAGDQLSQVALGQSVTVRYDVGDDALGERGGVVRRVASEAEFTPTPIQTREERADLVYAVEIAVPNADGVLKIGMPGELVLPDPSEGGLAAEGQP